MARSLGEPLGARVGFQVRHERSDSKNTAVLVVTEGILTRRLVHDPMLEGVGIVVLDEFHERSMHTDLALAFLRELLSVRDDLGVVVMSATLDAAAVAHYLGDDRPCPVVTSEGRLFDVSVEHISDRDERPLGVRMAGAVRDAWAKEASGDVLCFLPGMADISATLEQLMRSPLRGEPSLVPLHGQLSPADQDRAFAQDGRRKVVLATNVAETSITLPDVTVVIDSGLHRMAMFEPSTEEGELRTVRISRASAVQRAGRAGRVRAGRCVRLYGEQVFHTMAAAAPPELARIDLSSAILDVLAFHPGDPHGYAFFEAPPPARISHAVDVLQRLGAVDDNHRLTALGKRLHALPLHPRSAAVMVAVDDAPTALRVDVAQALAVLQDDRIRSRGDARVVGSSDLDELLRQADAKQSHDIDRSAQELLRTPRGTHHNHRPEQVVQSVGEALLAGFPDRVCARRKTGAPEARRVGGSGVTLARESVVKDAPLFLALSLKSMGSTSMTSIAVAIDEGDLRGRFPQALVDDQGARFDTERGVVVGTKRRRFFDLILDERDGASPSDHEAMPVLQAAVRSKREAVLASLQRDEEAQSLRWRLSLAAHHEPAAEWPIVDDDAMVALLLSSLWGKRRLSDALQAPWLELLKNPLSYAQQQSLDRLVPSHVEVPTGNRIRLDYEPTSRGEAPVLAVRLQELFGLADGPQVLGQPVVLHLLSPGHKPVQVTTDLRSFWNRTYQEVKKELRVRYKRHSWPDDPWNADPTDRAKRRQP
jgi:ATP-dependent helicase HrpB